MEERRPLLREPVALELPSFVYGLVVSTTITALFSPFAVLLVYVLRIATVARRTAAGVGPFVLRERIPDDEVGQGNGSNAG